MGTNRTVSESKLFFETANELLCPKRLLFLTTPNPQNIVSPPKHIALWRRKDQKNY